jgi:F-type H+-transporting ATPase subunit b
VKAEVETDRLRRIEEAQKQIAAETQRSIEKIRAEMAELTLIATAKVTGKVLDAADHKRLIEEAVSELDFSAFEESSK